MSANKIIEVLIPAFNEEKFVYETVKAVMSVPEVDRVLVVDDGSSDKTALKARRAGARVISLKRNMGKGEALNYGIKYLNEPWAIVLLDADLGASAAEARHLLTPLLKDEADMTVAQFSGFTRRAGFGLVKGLAREGIKRYTGLLMESPLSGQRALTGQVLKKTVPFASGFGVEVKLTISAVRNGFRVIEVPVDMNHNETKMDLGGFLHRGKQFWHVARVLVRAGQ